jgi:hypothetical protein
MVWHTDFLLRKDYNTKYFFADLTKSKKFDYESDQRDPEGAQALSEPRGKQSKIEEFSFSPTCKNKRRIKREREKERENSRDVTLPEIKERKRPPDREVMILCQTNVLQQWTVKIIA